MDLPEIRRAVESLPADEQNTLLQWLAAEQAQRRRAARYKPTLKEAVAWSAIALAVFFLIDAAIFRSGWYLAYLEPDSSAGGLELRLLWLRRSAPSKIPEVAMIGDSRMAEGFSVLIARQASGPGIRFRNMAVPGSTPRVWYYQLRDGDPDRNRFAAVVIGLDRYADEDGAENPADRSIDPNYLAGRLRLTDCFGFAASFDSPDLRRSAASGCVLKGLALRRDVEALLENPADRFRRARLWRNNGNGYIETYGGKAETLTGLTMDWQTNTMHPPPGLQPWQTATLNAMLLTPPQPQTGALTRYRERWLGDLVALYAGSRTRIIFVEMPRGPVPMRDSAVPARTLDRLARQRQVSILPAETFRDLEHPEVFADGLHLNRSGRQLFSERLGAKVAEMVGAR